MKKMSPKTVLFVALCMCGAFLCAGCMKPVGYGDFLDHIPIEQGIDVGYKGPKDIPLKIQWPDPDNEGKKISVKEGDIVPVSIGDIVAIEVTNTADYDGGPIKWYCQNSTLTKDVYVSGAFLLVNTITGDFFITPDDTYPISVTGKTKEGVPYSVLFLIQVVIKVES